MTMMQAAATQVTSTPGFWSNVGWLVAPGRMTSAAKNRAAGQAEALIAGEQAIEQAVMSGKIICPPGMDPEQVMRAMHSMALEAVERQARRERIAIKAYEMLPADKREQPVELREEFKIRFFHAAEEVSSEEVQDRWAKLLAGEIFRPGFFSLRTLDVLRNMSSEEAQLLQDYGKYAFDGIVFPPRMDERESDIFARNWVQLYEAGLAQLQRYVTNFVFQPGETAVYPTCHSTYYLKNIEKSLVDIGGHILTRAGRELVAMSPPHIVSFIESLNNQIGQDRLTYKECLSSEKETCTRRQDHLLWG